VSSQAAKLSLPMALMRAVRGLRGTRCAVIVSRIVRLLPVIRGSLQAKFILVIVSLIIALMGAVTYVVDLRQRGAILEQARLRALALGTSLAAVSEGFLLSYNFIQLEQAVEKVTSDHEDVLYAVAHLRDGRVAAYSERSDLQGTRLHDPVSQRALQANEPLVQEIGIPQAKDPGFDVSIPVYATGSTQKWGTIRLGFSLQRAYIQIHRTQRDLFLLSLVAILCGTSLAIFLAMRISKPIGQLVAGVHEFAKGSYDHPIEVSARDEIGYLARSFEHMRISLQRHLISLADEKRRLEEANRRLQETQQQLIQTERLAAVGKLAARVAHEVNNPLAIIKTAIRIIRNQSKEDDLAKGNLQEIEEEISRIARIIRELLDFSRPPPTDDVVQVDTVIQSLEPLLAQDLSEKRIVLRVFLEPDLPRVRISSDHLKQVVLNMSRNAEDAMPDGGELIIRTARNGEEVEVSIADTGCGIPEEYVRHLFDPFFSTKAQEKGMGLGLSVSYGIIKSAEGRIEVESEVGKGSTFRVSLPICEA